MGIVAVVSSGKNGSSASCAGRGDGGFAPRASDVLLICSQYRVPIWRVFRTPVRVTLSSATKLPKRRRGHPGPRIFRPGSCPVLFCPSSSAAEITYPPWRKPPYSAYRPENRWPPIGAALLSPQPCGFMVRRDGDRSCTDAVRCNRGRGFSWKKAALRSPPGQR